MAKVFRLYSEGSNTNKGWSESSVYPYNSTNRNTIADPDGASAAHEITSIPSPFARIDLVKTAFKEVCRSGKLDGKTIFHKMVSDSLDVGEIFFNIDKYTEQIEIIPCDINTMISNLSDDGNKDHQCLADALDKYLQSDSATYNFDKIDNTYLLNYIGEDKPGKINIIGATSPATLFFSSANDLSYVTNHIYFKDQDKPFDGDYKALYGRDFEYIKTWFILRKLIKSFSNLCPEVDEYLDLTYRMLDGKQKKEIDNIDDKTTNDYNTIDVTFDETANTVEVLGQSILKRRRVTNFDKCEFTIKPTKQIKEQLPLVLPVDSGGKYKDLMYTTGPWGKGSKAPYEDSQSDLSKRRLPCDYSTYPYITIGDLLEDTLIRVPHTLNKDNYFSGNMEIDSPKLSYLIPLKPLFFKYFSAEDLIKGTDNLDKIIEMKNVSGSVKVTLRIPIKGNLKVRCIEYSRMYYKENEADVEINKGGITEFDFTGLIMPIVKFNKPKDAYYTVACICGFSKKYKFEFFDGMTPLSNINKECRNETDRFIIKSENYTVKESNFDYIRITDPKGFHGLMIPKFRKQSNAVSYTFAVDLGTSNIHIEYKTDDDRNSQPFDYNEGNALACLFYKPSYDEGGAALDFFREKQLIENDFLPNQVGSGDFLFPTRTALSFKKQIDWTDKHEPYALHNVPLTYDKRPNFVYNKIDTNIKWGSGNGQQELKACVECIMLMIRNKVLLNDGDLGSTKITWFYPISMPLRRRNELETTWNDCYKKYFSSQNSLISMMTESEAPIHYYFKRYDSAKNLINIDIGGGTTDIAFASNGEIKHVTSFKFATNALFENPYSEIDTNNGIIDFYRKHYEELLAHKNNILLDIINIAKEKDKERPSDMACFLFSLRGNSIIKNAKIDDNSIDFNMLLRNDENFKIVFIIYYTSIIYHLANILKTQSMREPRHISFSGNGSKIVQVLTTNKKQLAKFTKTIFELVLNKKYEGELDIIGIDGETSPKEATCKGGIVGVASNLDDDCTIILKGDNSGLVDKESMYKDISVEYKQHIIESVHEFFTFVLDTLNRKFDYDSNFGVTKESMEIAKIVYKKDIDTWLDKGIKERMEENGDNKIEETGFFYPIKGAINTISQAIYESLKK